MIFRFFLKEETRHYSTKSNKLDMTRRGPNQVLSPSIKSLISIAGGNSNNKYTPQFIQLPIGPNKKKNNKEIGMDNLPFTDYQRGKTQRARVRT